MPKPESDQDVPHPIQRLGRWFQHGYPEHYLERSLALVLPRDGIYITGDGIWGSQGDLFDLLLEESRSQLRATGGFALLTELETWLGRNLPAMRKRLEESAAGVVELLPPGVWLDALFGKIVDQLSERDPIFASPDAHPGPALRDAIHRLADQATTRDPLGLSHHLSSLSESIHEREGRHGLLRLALTAISLSDAIKFEVAQSRYQVVGKVLGDVALYGISGAHASIDNLAQSSKLATDQKRTVRIGTALLLRAEDGDLPNLEGRTDSGFLRWAAEVIDRKESTARRVLEAAGVLESGRKGAVGASLTQRITCLFEVVKQLRPELQTRIESVENGVLEYYSKDPEPP